MYTNAIEVLLYIPPTLISYHEELEGFVLNIPRKLANTDIEIKVVDKFSKDTQIVISLVENHLGESDKIYFEKYQNREFRFLFYYFQDAELGIDDFSDEVFDRVEFKSEVERDSNLYATFEVIGDVKRSLEVNLKDALFDIEHKTNYSKINSSVISRSKGSKFYDNDNNLSKVDKFLRRAKRVSLINGFGGVGKTTLAIEYAKDALENEVYDYLIWLDIEKGIDNEIKTFAIKFLLSDMEDGKQEFIYYQKTFERFLAKYPNSLIVLDNYTQSKEYQERLQRFLKNFSSTDMIITSREDISRIVDIKSIKLEVFQTLDDALMMFRLNSTRSYSPKEEKNIRIIIQYLGNLPLALEITANFLNATNMGVDDYLYALKNEGLKLFDKISDYQPRNHLEGLIATLKINSKIRDNEDSLKLLKAFALISPEPINKTIIEKCLLKELDISPFNKIVSLQDLEKFSYIKLLKDNYSIHRLLQQSIQDEFFENNQDEQKEIITKVSLAIFNWFKSSFDEQYYGTYFAETVKHINYLLKEWEGIVSDEAKIYLYTCLSAYVIKPKESLSIIEEVIKLFERAKINEREKSIIYRQYANALSDNGKYDKALEYSQKNLNIVMSENNEIEISGSYRNIGRAYHGKKEYAKALEYYNKSLTLNLDNLEPNDSSIGINYGDIGAIYDDKKEYPEAMEFYNKSLEISLLNFGENHPSTAVNYNNLGLTFKSQKYYKKALEYYNKSLDIKFQTIGSHHPDTATTYYNIGFVYKDLKECQKAKESFLKALEIRTDLEIDEDIFFIKDKIKEIDRNIKKEQKSKFNKKGRYCKDA